MTDKSHRVPDRIRDIQEAIKNAREDDITHARVFSRRCCRCLGYREKRSSNVD